MSSIRSDGCDKGIQLIFLLFQLLDKTLNSSLSKAFTLSSLTVAHQAMHNAQAGIITCGSVRDWHLAPEVSTLGRLSSCILYAVTKKCRGGSTVDLMLSKLSNLKQKGQFRWVCQPKFHIALHRVAPWLNWHNVKCRKRIIIFIPLWGQSMCLSKDDSKITFQPQLVEKTSRDRYFRLSGYLPVITLWTHPA